MNISALKRSAMAMTAAAMWLSGCASDVQLQNGLRAVAPELVTGKLLAPDPLTPTIANVGDVMVSSGEFVLVPDSRVFKAAEVAAGTTVTIKHKLRTWRYPLRAGKYKLVAETEEGRFFQSIGAVYGKGPVAYGGIFVPNESPSAATEFYWTWTPPGMYVAGRVFTANLERPLPVTYGEHVETESGGAYSGATETLTYLGVAGGAIRFAYKEFTPDGHAKAAFTQEVALDYRPGETYVYRSARFIVHEAGPTHVKYTLLSGL